MAPVNIGGGYRLCPVVAPVYIMGGVYRLCPGVAPVYIMEGINAEHFSILVW